MSDAKVSRLINLTMALLGKKYVTKSTILKNVEGYAGSHDTMDRMFERDKNDLRDLGIIIDVGGFDPLFDDEPGYRILNSEYALDLGELTSEEVSLLALATTAWQDSTQSTVAQSALRKIRSLDALELADSADLTLSISPITSDQSSGNFNELWSAINERCEVVFDYSSARTGTQSRRLVQPYGLGNWQGAWYLAGHDVERKEIRTFKLSRFVGEVRRQAKNGTFEIPPDFKIQQHLDAAHVPEETPIVVKVRRGTAHKIRMVARPTHPIPEEADEAEDWETLTIAGKTKAELMSTILWHGSDVEVVEPLDLRTTIIDILKSMRVSGQRR